MAEKTTSGQEFGTEIDPRTGESRKTLKGDPSKKGFSDPRLEKSTGLGALAKAMAEKRKKKQKESLGGNSSTLN